MSALRRCPSCSGFVPSSVIACPNCGTAEPAGSRIGAWLEVAGGCVIAVTMMACYGVPPEGTDLPTTPDAEKSDEAIEADDAAPKAEPPKAEPPKTEQPKAEQPEPDDPKAEPGQPDAPQ